jgi:hypothetical protein
MHISHIDLPRFNRMIRFGVGQHNGNWFMRLDLWWIGFRVS